MKNLKYNSILFFSLWILASCEPIEDRDELGSMIGSEELQYKITQDSEYDNKVTMQNLTPGSIAFWDFGSGTSNLDVFTAVFPFAGEHEIIFTAYTRAGAVQAPPHTITVTENDQEFFSDPVWNHLTNGTAGKTWMLDTLAPIGWYGFEYGGEEGHPDNWAWHPDYAGNSWTMEKKDWGEMTFNLDGNFNYTVAQTALDGDEQTVKSGTFELDIEGEMLKFNGGGEMLYGGDYYPDVSIWNDVRIIDMEKLANDTLRLAVIRDQSRTGEDPCYITFQFRPKE